MRTTAPPLPRLAPPALLALLGIALACGGGGGPGAAGSDDRAARSAAAPDRADADAAAERALRGTLARSVALADSMDDILRPVPLMRPAQEAALRRYSNDRNLERARALGARPADSAALASLVAEGRLVRLADSTRFWVVRELTDSRPFVTPDARALLERVGERFQHRLEAMGLPPLRLEVSSALRTAADQEALRGRNVNAAAGTSAHEFGTTVDLAYGGFAAPAESPVTLPADAPAAMRPDLERVARAVVERTAARKSRELKSILGEVLAAAQADGLVLVTLESLQPVYHITVARRLGGD